MVLITPHYLVPSVKRVSLVKRPTYQRQHEMPYFASTATTSSDNGLSSQNNKRPNKKSVRFNDDLAQVKLFYSWQSPQAVGETIPFSSSCRLDHVMVCLRANWDNKRDHGILPWEPVRLESVRIHSTSRLEGSCRVANLAFEKHVSIRYTTDNWESYSDVDASYQASFGTWDRFTFYFNLSSHSKEPISVQFALRYSVRDQEFWDNNKESNYICVLQQRVQPKRYIIHSANEHPLRNPYITSPLHPVQVKCGGWSSSSSPLPTSFHIIHGQ